MNPIGRWLLLNLVILRTRPAQSGEAYSQIWTEEGSPLLVHSENLTTGVQESLGEHYVAELGMRYGSPSIPSALQKLADADVERIVVVPLFPQYASAATGSALDLVYKVTKAWWNVPSLLVVPAFYDDTRFIDAFVAVSKPQLEEFKPDYVLFSYHGLPERHCTKSDPTGAHCLKKSDCCDRIEFANRFCYRAQCYATTRAMVEKLGLSEDAYSVSFQSRLGKTPWIRPYTDEELPKIAEKGFKRIAVYCPAFVADCLETLEEIGIRADEDWKGAGGEALRLVTSLNAEEVWIQAVADMVREQAEHP